MAAEPPKRGKGKAPARGKAPKKTSNAVLVGPSSVQSKKQGKTRKKCRITNAVLVGANRSSSEPGPSYERFDDEPSSSESEESEISDSMFSDEELEMEQDVGMEQQPARLPGAMPLVPRTAHIDNRLRKKIRKGEYINFRQLLDKKKLPKKNSSTRDDGRYEEQSNEDNLPILLWIDAYIVFMSVNLDYFPTQAQGMLRHMQIVKRMCSMRKDGVEYDTQFRRLKDQHSYIKWGEFLPELAAEIEQTWTPRYNIGKWSGRARKPFMKSRQVCFKFNSKEGCRWENCGYLHKCEKCMSVDHPAHRCSKN